MLGADLLVVPAARGAQREAAAEAVLAQSALDYQQAVAHQHRRELTVGFCEERALQATAPVFDLHEHLAVALLAQADDLPGDDRLDLLAPTAAARLGAVLPDLLQIAQVVSDQSAQLIAIRIERMAAEVMTQRLALAVEDL